MAGKGDDWSSFMQSRPTRLVLNGLCTLLCAFYAIDALVELMDPARSAPYVETVGVTGYHVLTIARLVVCVWVAVVFGRMTLRTLAERDDDDGDGA